MKAKKDKLYLDIGCGTGNYTLALADRGLDFVGIDPSSIMLKEAKSRSQKVKWLTGSAEQIPMENQSFEGAIATLTIHHWEDLEKAFSEMNRVLAINGRIVIFTSTSEQMNQYWLNHYFPKMLHHSIVQMPSFSKIKYAIASADLEIIAIEKYFIKNDLQDGFLYIGKNHPELYFNQKVRNGISSFSSLANGEEIKNGLQKLKHDLSKGTFESLRKGYDKGLGDYMFIVIKKRSRNLFSSG